MPKFAHYSIDATFFGKDGKHMKRLPALLLAVLMLATFAACKPREDTVSQEPESRVSEPESKPESIIEPESEPESSENIINTDAENKERALAEARLFLEAVQDADKAAISEYVDYQQLLGLTNNPDVSEQQVVSILSGMDYTVDKVRQDDSAGRVFAVEATVTNTNMQNVMSTYLNTCRDLEYENGLSDEPLESEELEKEYADIFVQVLEDHKDDRLESYVYLNLYRDGELWEISPSLNLTDALLGGYYAALNSGETA